MSADLATVEGLDALCAAANGRAIDVLLANAGSDLGSGFLDQRRDEARPVIDTNITDTVYLLPKVGNAMRTRGGGRVLITGSIAGFMPDRKGRNRSVVCDYPPPADR